jgi:succinyl-diaminopimelate desuccinylase
VSTETNARALLEQRLQRDRDQIIRFVQDLTRIPSENPPGDTTRVFEYLRQYLDERHIDFEVVAPQPSTPNIVASFEGSGPGKHLVLNGHLDVFPAGDPARWSDDPFSGKIEDGRLYGRGVNDMKAGTAASILAYRYLHEIRDQLKGRLTLTVVSEEENFGPFGARHLIENRPDVRGDCLLNGEPSTQSIVRFGEKGLLWLELRIKTKGGHGGYPQMSASAIKEAAQIIVELESAIAGIENSGMPPEVEERIEAARSAFDAELGPGSSDNLKRVTLNTGMIHGGTKMNMIPAECWVTIDIRCPIGVPTSVPLGIFEEIIGRYEGTSYEIVMQTEPNWVDPNHEMIGIVQRNAERVRGIRPMPNVSLGGTDARLWRLRGIPGIVYGPTPYNLSSYDEYVTIEDLLATVQVHTLSAFDYLTGAS